MAIVAIGWGRLMSLKKSLAQIPVLAGFVTSVCHRAYDKSLAQIIGDINQCQTDVTTYSLRSLHMPFSKQRRYAIAYAYSLKKVLRDR